MTDGNDWSLAWAELLVLWGKMWASRLIFDPSLRACNYPHRNAMRAVIISCPSSHPCQRDGNRTRTSETAGSHARKTNGDGGKATGCPGTKVIS